MSKIERHNNNLQLSDTEEETVLFSNVAQIIEKRKFNATSAANSHIVLMFWEIGKYINSAILGMERAEYGKKIVVTLSRQLIEKYGKSFEDKNLRRMMQFASQFDDEQIVVTLSRQLSWSHFLVLLPLKTTEEKLYYATETAKQFLSVRDLRHVISRKGYERREIANLQIKPNNDIPFNALKDPYLLDTLDLKDSFLEGDLEKAILLSLEKFIMEFGKGDFCFVESQKRMIIDGEDFKLDLLFYHRVLKRLVAIDLKIGRFMPAYKGQMELYLAWLKDNEMKEDENSPIGIILCTQAQRQRIEYLQLEKSGIAVAEYWTKLPPKEQFESKIREMMAVAKERIERRKMLGHSNVQKQINYFLEESSDAIDNKE
jgi:predicted nuclease of restriction endonuclease-like (RecB) superfamily